MCEEEEEGRPGRGEKSTADFSKALLCKAVWLEEVVEVEVGGGGVQGEGELCHQRRLLILILSGLLLFDLLRRQNKIKSTTVMGRSAWCICIQLPPVNVDLQDTG